MQYLFDEKGRRYLDMFAGIATVACGHCHPKIIERTKEQVDKLQHASTIYLHPGLGEMAKKLASKLPDELGVAYFVNSGSEANDLAMTMARLYTGNNDIIALKNSYHGAISSTMGLTSHHTWKYPVPHGQGIHHVACPDPYQSNFSGTPEEVAKKSVADLIDEIDYSTCGKVAAFIAEPMQGVGGVTHGTAEYYQEAYKAIRERGGVCIADEVQTGFGRTGDNYWGFQNLGVMPDIVTMAKGIGNGIPLAAVCARKDIAETLTQRIHFNTFGGNPVSMAQGLAVLEVIDEDNLMENARVVGGHLKAGLMKLMEKHQIIGDVRGKGLMLGVELVEDRKSRVAATPQAAEIVERAKEHGVLIGKGGLRGNVLRLKPPLCITKEDADFTLAVLDSVISGL
jgi:alanine-glyoxylate transaminase/(R)-3-amino-2-methylpropionate-pyruvate transaminase